MRKFVLIISLSIPFFLGFTSPTDAAIVDKNVSRIYTFEGEAVRVKEQTTLRITDPRYLIQAGTEEIFVVFNPAVEDKFASEKIRKTLPTIKVTDDNGKRLNFTTEVDGQNINIKVIRPKGLLHGVSETYNVEYDSFALSSRSGAVYDIYIPSFAKNFPFQDNTTNRTISTRVLIPKKFGDINIAIPDKEPLNSGNNWRFDFSQQELTGRISWIQIGTVQYYQFNLQQPYQATSSIPFLINTYAVLLPRDVEAGPLTQNVFFHQISPAPTQVRQDGDGNLVAEFSFPANQSGVIKIDGYVEVESNRKIKTDNAGVLEDIKADYIASFTSPGQFWEVNAPSIQAQAQKLKGEETDVYKIISKTYSYVVDQIDYSEVKRFGINERQGALKTLEGGAAVCMEYSDLFITLMRAQGIPARAAFGYGYDARSTNGEETPHQWAEVYNPKLNAWILVDTTWGESGPAVIGGDLNHFYKYVTSLDPQTPAPVEVSFFGSMKEVPNEKFTITALSKPNTTTSSLTQAELLAEYPQRDSLNRAWQNVSTGASTSWLELNLVIEKLLQNLGLDENSSRSVKQIIFILPGIILVAWLILITVRHLKDDSSSKASLSGIK